MERITIPPQKMGFSFRLDIANNGAAADEHQTSSYALNDETAEYYAHTYSLIPHFKVRSGSQHLFVTSGEASPYVFQTCFTRQPSLHH